MVYSNWASKQPTTDWKKPANFESHIDVAKTKKHISDSQGKPLHVHSILWKVNWAMSSFFLGLKLEQLDLKFIWLDLNLKQLDLNLEQLNSKLKWLESRLDTQSFQVSKIRDWVESFEFPVTVNLHFSSTAVCAGNWVIPTLCPLRLALCPTFLGCLRGRFNFLLGWVGNMLSLNLFTSVSTLWNEILYSSETLMR